MFYGIPLIKNKCIDVTMNFNLQLVFKGKVLTTEEVYNIYQCLQSSSKTFIIQDMWKYTFNIEERSNNQSVLEVVQNLASYKNNCMTTVCFSSIETKLFKQMCEIHLGNFSFT